MTGDPTSLRDALYALSLAKAVPDAELLEELTRRYPQHAATLTEYAIDLALDALRGADEEPAGPEEETITPDVARAMSAFQNRLFEIDREASKVSPAAHNPFGGLDRKQFRALAASIPANTLFLNKLRDRQVDPNTIPSGFHRHLSEKMNVPVEVLASYFGGSPEMTKRLYKSDDKPVIGQQQSFADAVRSSELSESQQEFLLKL